MDAFERRGTLEVGFTALCGALEAAAVRPNDGIVTVVQGMLLGSFPLHHSPAVKRSSIGCGPN